MHFTNGMVPLASPVPTVVTIHDMSLTLYPALPSAAARAAQSSAGRSRGAPGRRDHHRLAERQARHRPAVRPATRARARRARSGGAVVPARSRSGRARARAAALRPRRALHPLRRHDRAAEEPADADRGASRARRKAGDLPHQLVCVGPYGWLSRDIEDRIERARRSRDAIRFTGYVPFEDLPALYSLAEMFVFPSLYEGFGLPVIEAMACGTPVITGPRRGAAGGRPAAPSSTSMRLDAGRARARRWSRWRASRERREQLSALGLRAGATFSWERAARETLEVYRLARSASAGTAAAELPTAARAGNAGRRRCRRARRAPRIAATVVTHRRAVRPGVLPALRSEAVGSAGSRTRRSARCTRRPAVRARGYASRCSTRCSPSPRPSGRPRSTAHRPRFAVIYEDSFNYLSKMCLLRMREAALDDDRRGARARRPGRSSPDRTRAIIPASTSIAARGVVIAGEGEVTLVELLDVLGRPSRAAADRRAGRLVLRDATAARRPHARRARSSATSTRCRCRRGISSTSSATARIWRARHGYFSMNVVTTRGCPYHCNWCAKPIYGQRYTARSPERVVDEMAWLKRDLPARPPLVRRRHLRAEARLDRALRRRWCASATPSMPFKCLLRADRRHRRGRRGASRAPAAGRSGSAPSRARSGSSTRWRRARASSRSPRRRGGCTRRASRSGFFLQFGYPGETREDIELTLQMVRDCRARRHRHVGVVPAAGHAVLRARQGAARREAELGRLERPGDDVPRDLRRRSSTARCTRSCTREFRARNELPRCARSPPAVDAAPRSARGRVSAPVRRSAAGCCAGAEPARPA